MDSVCYLCRVSLLRWVSVVSVWLLVGCAITPQPGLGSALKPGQFAPGPVWGTSYGQSEARVRANDGVAHRVRGNGDSVLGVAAVHAGVVVPMMGVARASVWPRLDLGAHAGWYGAGGGARLRITDPDACDAVYVMVEGQVGYALPHDDRTARLGVPYAGRVLTETAWSVGSSWQLLGAAGVSAGYRRHGVDVGGFLPNISVDRVVGAENTLVVQRPEARLEGSVGAFWGVWRFGMQWMVMPYFVIGHGIADFECLNCAEPVFLESYEQHWGVSVLFNPFFLVGPV